ncbi:MAG: hypothetical protein NC097_08355 [Clostridium sp.]|nr:hypothetical protein [Clostridium sp.]
MDTKTSVQNAVDNLFANKTFTLGYMFETVCSDYGEEQYHYEVLSPQNYNLLYSLFEKYGYDEMHLHLDEVFDTDKIYDLSHGEELTNIVIDAPQKLYHFGIHSLLKDGTLQLREHNIPLEDDEYKKLLELMLEDQSLNFNSLEYADNKLYRSIKLQIDNMLYSGDFYENTSPFIVSFDEAQEDVEKILAEHPEWKSSGTCMYSICGATPKKPIKYFCTVSVSRGERPESINDVIGVLHGTAKGVMEKIPYVALHSSHYPYLEQLMYDAEGNKKEWGRYIHDDEIRVNIPEQGITYCFNFFPSDIEDDEDRIESQVSVCYDDNDMAEMGLPFFICDVYTRESDNDDTNQGRLAYPSKDFYINAL